MKKFIPRKSTYQDLQQIFELYKNVSKNTGGIARSNDEITKSYIEGFVNKSLHSGIQLVIPSEDATKIIAEIHCYQLEAKVFSHILSELTVVVDPTYQRKGLGKIIFKSLLDTIAINRSDILRVELIARESNIKAINFYQQLGFNIEGRLEKRIRNNDSYEADIPMAWFNKNYGVTYL